MSCVTGKRMYESKSIAEEALIAARTRTFSRENAGPTGVYRCDDCGKWHLTSKGASSKLLSDDSIKEAIKRQQESDYWEQKFR